MNKSGQNKSAGAPQKKEKLLHLFNSSKREKKIN